MSRVINPFALGGSTPGPDGEVFWYRGADGVTDNGTDGNGWNGTYNGDMTTVTDDGKAAYLLDGTGDYMSLGTISMGAARTISLWFKNDSGSSGYRRFFQVGSNEFSALLWTGTDAISVYTNGSLFDTATTASTGVWHHLTVEQASGTIYVYLDNSSIGSSSKTLDAATALSGLIGSTTGGAQFWKGRLDDIRGYDRRITDTERTNLYETGRY